MKINLHAKSILQKAINMILGEIYFESLQFVLLMQLEKYMSGQKKGGGGLGGGKKGYALRGGRLPIFNHINNKKLKYKPERDVPHPVCHISLRLVFFLHCGT